MALSGPVVRWYGWMAVLGGVLFAASDFAARLLVAALDGGGAATGGYALWTTLSLLSLALLQLALIGLYSPHRQTAGTLGWVGFFLASTGIAFAFFIVLVYAVAASPLPIDDPELLEEGPPAMFLLYFPLFSAGWVLLGAAFLTIPSYPRWAVRLLGLGAVIALYPNPLTTVVFGAAVAWLGLTLVLGDAPPPCNQLAADPLFAAKTPGSCATRAGTSPTRPPTSWSAGVSAGAPRSVSRSSLREPRTGRERCSRSKRPRRRKSSASWRGWAPSGRSPEPSKRLLVSSETLPGER